MASRPRVLFAWELGANFGHVAKVIEVAQPMLGHADVYFAARDVANVRRFAAGIPLTLLPAPFAMTRETAERQPPLNYTDDVRVCGWSDAVTLGALTESWGALLDLIKPDILVAQAAPISLLAARGRPLRTVMLGSGYDAPARANPMPLFAQEAEDPAATARMIEREANVVAIANQVLAQRRAPPLAAFCDLLATDFYALSTFEEIDHYAPRQRFEAQSPPYLGQLMTLNAGEVVHWRADATDRIYAYLQPGNAQFLATLDVLMRLPPTADVVIVAPGAPPEVIDRTHGSHVRLLTKHARLDHLLPDATIGISHGSNNVAAAMMIYGVPQICLPQHIEQMMAGRVLAKYHLGAMMGAPQISRHLPEMLVRLRTDSRITTATAAAKKKYQAWRLARSAHKIAADTLALIGAQLPDLDEAALARA